MKKHRRPTPLGRKVAALVAVLGASCLGLVASQASATVDAPAAITSQAGTQTAQVERNQKMGALPMQSTICAANGVGGTYPLAYVLGQWNDTSYGALRLSVLNRCDGYSITNRLTVEAYTDSTSTCGKFTQAGSVWDARQGKYIYNQNPVVWVNLNDICAGNDTVKAHRFAMYVGYILGLGYTTTTNRVMCNTSWCNNNIKYVTGYDIRDMAGVYGLTA
jgi:hypothetical protein